jgi:hypothetical protein
MPARAAHYEAHDLMTSVGNGRDFARSLRQICKFLNYSNAIGTRVAAPKGNIELSVSASF